MSIPACEPSDHASAANLADVDAESLHRAAAIFRALGEPGRLRILALLSRQPMCVTELATVLGDNVSTVSQRLKLLRGERLARSRREGKHIFYALADQHIADLVANAFEHANESSRPVVRARPATGRAATGRAATAKRAGKPRSSH